MSIAESDPARPAVHRETDALPRVKTIGFAEVTAALGRGMSDFWQRPSHYLFLCVIYPVLGFAIGLWTSGGNAFQLLYPLATGFALLGPLAATGLYEVSRRREAGEEATARHAFLVLRSPHLPQLLQLGAMLAVVFVAWIAVAQALYAAFYGDAVPRDFAGWIADLFTTQRGWGLILAGNAIGAVFAIVVLATTVIAFPMLVDRGGSVFDAIATSVRVVLANPVPMLTWGAIVVGALILGAIPLMVGLAVVLPILGHATWHLYRGTVTD